MGKEAIVKISRCFVRPWLKYCQMFIINKLTLKLLMGQKRNHSPNENYFELNGNEKNYIPNLTVSK
jgi:hypothetical protein